MPRRDALLAAAVAAVWGVNFVVIHVGLRSWPPLLFAAGFAVLLLGERPDRRRLAGAALAFAGIGVIALDRGSGRSVPLGALLLVVVAAASWGLSNICSRVAQAPDALALLVWSSLVPPLPLAVASLAFEGPRSWARRSSWPAWPGR